MDEENSLNFGLSTFNCVNSEFLFQDALWHDFQDIDIPFTANELANSNVNETIKNENSLNNDYFGEYDPSDVFTASTSTAQTQQDVSNTPSFMTEIPKIPSEDVNYNFSSIPASMNWPGEFNFSIAFGSQKKNTKGVSWTYSDVKNKLYVGKDASCPINFSVNTSLPAGVFIRAVALYSTSEHMSEVVHRCANHSTEEKKKG
ncbi:Cellular tumor antigen p53, partial [Stegodyphus mimosarum]